MTIAKRGVLGALTLLVAASPLRAQAALNALIAPLDKEMAPGCSILANGPGTTVRRNFGYGSLEQKSKINSATVFHAGSVAKQVTALSVLILASQGKLSLDQSLSHWLPEFKGPQGRATIRELLQHTSGIRDYQELLFLAGGRDSGPIDRSQVLDLLSSQRALNFTHGSEFSYSNSGYFLLGEVVQKAAGVPLADFAQNELFKPLGMSATRFVDRHDLVMVGRAQGYRRAGEDWVRADYLSDVYGDGGLFTSADDLSRWAQMIAAPPASWRDLIAQMTTRTQIAAGAKIPWGMGVELHGSGEGATIGHGGRDFGYQAYMIVRPARRSSAVVLCNGRELDAQALAEGALSAVDTEPSEASQAAKSEPPLTGALAAPVRETQLLGIYFNPKTLAVRRVERRDKSLFWVRGDATTALIRSNGTLRFEGRPVFIDKLGSGARSLDVVAQSGGEWLRSTYVQVSPPVKISAGTLGTYSSDETNSSLQVCPRGKGILISGGPSFSFEAEPKFRNAYGIGDDLLIQVQTGALELSTARARRVRFIRTSRRANCSPS